MSMGIDENGFYCAPLARRGFLFAMFAPVSILLGCGSKAKPEQKVVDLYISSDGDFLAFKPDTLTCPAGATVHLTFHHAGRLITVAHNWVLTYPAQLNALVKECLDNDGILPANDPHVIATTGLCPKGATVTTQFVAPPPGDYPFICSTHPEDMQGTLHVTK